MKTSLELNRSLLSGFSLIMAVLCLSFLCIPRSAMGSITLFHDAFETYPVQNPASNPLTNGPAGGQWHYVDPAGALTANEHRIFDAAAAGGSGMNSRCWISITNDAKLTNAIAISALPAGAGPHTFRLSFVAGPETGSAARSLTFRYGISSTSGSLSFVSGGNQDGSVTFTGLEDYGTNWGGITGKSADRRFDIVFQGTGLSITDKIIFEFTRITNNAGAAQYIAFDDFLLTVDDGKGPILSSATPVLTMEHVQLSFAEPVDPVSAVNIANYTLSGGLSVLSATLIDPMAVELRTTPQTPATIYTLTASGVTGRTGIAMSSTQKPFTTAPIVVSSVRYDAGTTLTRPGGPLSPDSPEAGYWAMTTNANAGLEVAPLTDDSGTGFNAWQITDQNVTAATGGIDYRMPIDPLSDRFARTNGWRLTARVRYVESFYSSAADHTVLYGDPQTGINLRYGLFFGLNADGNLFAQVFGGATYVLTTDPGAATAYHDHVMVFDPVNMRASYYFDGQLIATNCAGQSPPGYNGVAFGSASATGTGRMNYNLVQLDVVNGAQPGIIASPQDSTNGVGQKVTFVADLTPFVASFQWLSNNVIIPGATSSSYTTDFITMSYDGTQYKCRALHALGNVETAPATLTVTSDTEAPVVASIKGSLLYDRVIITFSEPVLEAYATDINNYVWTTPGIMNVSARMLDQFTVELRTTSQPDSGPVSLNISNIRDTSNLVISPGSAATFYNLGLVTQASYYAGTTTDAPSGPPDPASIAGGNWTALIASDDPELTVTGLMDDMGTGLHAWQVRDATAGTRKFAQYVQPLNAEIHESANQGGWVLTLVARMAEDFGTAGAHFAQYSTEAGYRFLANYDLNSAGDLTVGLWVTNGYTVYPLTFGDGGTAYHTNQIVYDPATRTASYYMDGAYIANWIGGDAGTNATPGIFWGAASSVPMGTMNYHLVEFRTADLPAVSATRNGSNIDVHYRGILEAAAALPGTWSPVATNLTGVATTYTVPASASPQNYFRARLP